MRYKQGEEKALVGAFNKEKALVGSGGLLRALRFQL